MSFRNGMPPTVFSFRVCTETTDDHRLAGPQPRDGVSLTPRDTGALALVPSASVIESTRAMLVTAGRMSMVRMLSAEICGSTSSTTPTEICCGMT